MDNTERTYFSKMEFTEARGYFEKRITLLNLAAGELSYQVIDYIPEIDIDRKRAGATREEVEYKYKMLHRQMCTSMEIPKQKVIFSWGHKLTPEEIEELKPYCEVHDFEPFRNREMSMDDPGWRGYRDEVGMNFLGISDSWYPALKLPMDYIYDEKHIWPSEKLYRFLCVRFFNRDKKVSKYAHYGAGSLIL